VTHKYPYRPSFERKLDLLDTKLNVRFDWEKQYLYGNATLTLTPFFMSKMQPKLMQKAWKF
ncbi:MAG: hypothetical protein LRY27_02705, partial [Chitinophagales bacterium]|nr:hypothetical protein [Chitinophagales bacterium]